MTDEIAREEIDKLLNRANELIGQSPINWRDVSDLMDQLRAVVLQAERHRSDDN